VLWRGWSSIVSSDRGDRGRAISHTGTLSTSRRRVKSDDPLQHQRARPFPWFLLPCRPASPVIPNRPQSRRTWWSHVTLLRSAAGKWDAAVDSPGDHLEIQRLFGALRSEIPGQGQLFERVKKLWSVPEVPFGPLSAVTSRSRLPAAIAWSIRRSILGCSASPPDSVKSFSQNISGCWRPTCLQSVRNRARLLRVCTTHSKSIDETHSPSRLCTRECLSPEESSPPSGLTVTFCLAL